MNKSNPLISVITPVYNRAKYLPECINSILSQSYENFEFIIIDDKSTDGTNEIIKNYASKDSRIIVLKNDKNIGATISFNRGLGISKGKYIARMDSDDISLPKRFEKQISIFQFWSNLDVLGTGAILIDQNGNTIGKKQFASNYEEIKKTLNFGVPVFDPSVMIKSNLLKESGGFDERLAPADDYHLWLTLFKKKKTISNINEYLIKYRIHDSNLSKLSSKEQLEKSFLALKIYKSVFSTDEFFKSSTFKELTNFEELVALYLSQQNPETKDLKKILNEYFISKKNVSSINRSKILTILKILFLRKKFILFFYYLLKMLINKFITR
jgi:glycosyltransferase involved in cell wall biosynthesis